MTSSIGLDAYRSHDLSIAMKTSSGDVINMDFSNQQSASFSQTKTANGSQTSASFSSMQSFSFSIDSNGISEQDQKEIDQFMKIAQPFIDSFINELKDSAPKSPVTKLAEKIANIFEPNRDRNENAKNNIKNNIVKTFDNSLQQIKPSKELSLEDIIKNIFKDTQNLLEKTLKEFDNVNKNIYV